MKPQNPDKECIGHPACRNEICTASPDEGNPRMLRNDEVRLCKRYIMEDDEEFRPVRNEFVKTGLRGTFPRTKKVVCRKIMSTEFRNFQTFGSAIRKIFFDRSFRNFFVSHIFFSRVEQMDSFRSAFIAHIRNPGRQIDTLEDRPGPYESQTVHAPPVQERRSADRPDTFRAGGNLQ